MISYNVLRQGRRRFSRGYYGIVLKLDSNSSKCKVLALGVMEQSVDDLPWASVQNSFGSASHGMVFSPRVGDKVVVIFPTGDANHPVIQAGYNVKPSQFPSPSTQHGWQDSKGNYLKVDEDKETFVLHLSTGAEISVDANNKMTIKATDICIESTGDIDMTAGGDLNINAVEINSTATSVSTTATSVSTTADLIDDQAVQINSAATGPNVITGSVVTLN